jgi:hypothetical protein
VDTATERAANKYADTMLLEVTKHQESFIDFKHKFEVDYHNVGKISAKVPMLILKMRFCRMLSIIETWKILNAELRHFVSNLTMNTTKLKFAKGNAKLGKQTAIFSLPAGPYLSCCQSLP